MVGTSVKKRTFKQRIRKNGMKARHKVSSELRKRARLGRRTSNTFDHVAIEARPLEEMVGEIAEGSAIPVQELSLDPRQLTDMLLRAAPSTAAPQLPDAATTQRALTSNTSKSLQLPTAPLPPDDAAALPDPFLREADAKSGDGTGPTAAQRRAKNLYRHHGQPYLFWERIGLHPLLLQALHTMHFTHPTPVQEEVMPVVLPSRAEAGTSKVSTSSETKAKAAKRGKKAGEQGAAEDVIVSAETGSGKTLVFALPILQDLLLRMDAGEGNTSAETKETQKEDNNEEEDDVVHDAKGRKRMRAAASAATKAECGVKRRRHEATKAEAKSEAKEEQEEEEATAKRSRVPAGRLMHALILSPTRELALQISAAMQQLTQHCPHITIGCIVGGMAAEKQQRILNRHPHILICTPGRLWELVQQNEGCYLGHSISRRLHYVVLDEADKMLQSGRFEQLKSLLERIHCEVLPAGFVQAREEGAEVGEGAELQAGRWDEATQKFVPFDATSSASTTQSAATAAADKKKNNSSAGNAIKKKKDQPRPIPMPPAPPAEHRVRTYVTSATLSLQTNYERKDFKSHKSIIRTSNEDTLQKVLQQLAIAPSQARVFSVGPASGVAATINETFLRCPDESKDLYLYYFLRTYRDARAIVFVNAISMLRRLVKLLGVLGIATAGLHASMQQRQRLKFIDKFAKGELRVLVATDVAARGLDIEGVRYIVHYQVPRTTDAYIHRCGRTARCGDTGLSLLLVNAQEHVSFRKLMESLGRSASAMETFALQPTVVHQLHAHLRIARQIDKLQKEVDKSRARNQWVQRVSREADLEVDDMYDDEADSENKAKLKAIRLLKKELELCTRKFTGSYGGKGAFRTSANALGAMQAEAKLKERAGRQTLQLKRKAAK